MSYDLKEALVMPKMITVCKNLIVIMLSLYWGFFY